MVSVTARVGRAITLARQGDHARATDDVEALAGRDGLTNANVYDLACLFSLSSAAAGRDETLSAADRARLKAKHAERAMELLEKAVAMGYRHPTAMRADPDLEPLRDRDDFRKLLADLETEQKGSEGGQTGR